jgi:hypothetical protein
MDSDWQTNKKREMQEKLFTIAKLYERNESTKFDKTVNSFSINTLANEYYKVKDILFNKDLSEYQKLKKIYKNYKIILGIFLIFISFLLFLFV